MSPVSNEVPSEDPGIPSRPASNDQNASNTSLTEVWITLRKRLWIILVAALIGVAFGFYQNSVQPRLFVATGTIEIRSGASNEFRLSGASSGNESYHIPTQVTILKSDSILMQVARDLNLANNPSFIGGVPARPRNIDDPVIRQQVLGGLRGVISIAPITKTDIITISCSTLDPKLSSDIINTLVTEYIHHTLQSRADATNRVTEFFSHQLDDLKNKVELSQEQLIDLQKNLGVLGFDPNLNQVTTSLGELDRAANAAELNRIQAETRYRVTAGLDRGTAAQPIDATRIGSVVTQLRSQLETAQAGLAQLSANLGPNHPQVLALKSQIAELTTQIHSEQDRVLTDARQAYLAASANEDRTRGVLEAKKADAFKLRDDLIKYTLQQRLFDANRTLYEGLEQRLHTAGVQAGLESTEIDIVDVAVPPIAPSLKPRSTFLVVDVAVMVIIGIILAFVLDSLDAGLGSVFDVETAAGLPSLALIPRFTRRNTVEDARLSPALRNITVLSHPKGQSAEAFRALRTSLLLSTAGHEPRTILLTSATPADGKTTVSINLACVLAQRDVRVLLIDADLRRPTVHHRFGLNGRIGLTSVLTGGVTLQEAIQTVPEVPGLDILVSGPIPPFPTEILSSSTMKQLIEHCRGLYTHIVIDSPPLLSVTDSVVLSREADAVVLIVRSGKTSKHALRRARDLLVRSGSRVTGIAINAVNLNSPEYYAYHGYSGYSGYSSAGVDSAGWEATSDQSSPQSRSESRSEADRKAGKR